MINVLQILGGAVLLAALLGGMAWVLIRVLEERPSESELEAFRTHQRLRDIRRQTIRELLETSRQAERQSGSTSQGYDIMEAEDERP